MRYKVGDTFKYNGNDVTVTEVYDNGYLVTYEHEGSKYITRVLIGQVKNMKTNGVINLGGEDCVEYVRKDAFVEKAWGWIEDNLLTSNQQDKAKECFEDFKNYMKGE